MKHHLALDPSASEPPTRDLPGGANPPNQLPEAKETKVHPSKAGNENASLLFVGTATTILYDEFILDRRNTIGMGCANTKGREWEGIRLMTDPV